MTKYRYGQLIWTPPSCSLLCCCHEPLNNSGPIQSYWADARARMTSSFAPSVSQCSRQACETSLWSHDLCFLWRVIVCPTLSRLASWVWLQFTPIAAPVAGKALFCSPSSPCGSSFRARALTSNWTAIIDWLRTQIAFLTLIWPRISDSSFYISFSYLAGGPRTWLRFWTSL